MKDVTQQQRTQREGEKDRPTKLGSTTGVDGPRPIRNPHLCTIRRTSKNWQASGGEHRVSLRGSISPLTAETRLGRPPAGAGGESADRVAAAGRRNLRDYLTVASTSDPELKRLLIERYDEIGDRSTRGTTYVNRDGWWRDPAIIERLPAALCEPFRAAEPTVVLGPQSSGYLLGPLVAHELKVGFVGARKEVNLLADSDAWLRVSTSPDYRDRHLELGFRRNAIRAADRVLIVDDWADTGSQLLALQKLVNLAEGRIVGTVVIADALTDSRVRRDLQLTALVHARELWK